MRSNMFVLRLQNRNKLDPLPQTSSVWEDFEESNFEAWFLLDPRQNLLRFWYAILTVVFWFDLLQVPLVYTWPQILAQISGLVWLCDIAWLAHICINFITIRLDIDSRDSIDIILEYLKNRFIFDVIATVPSILSLHSLKFYFLRTLHIINFDLVESTAWLLLQTCFWWHRTRTMQFLSYSMFTIILVHYFACVWIYLGDKFLLGDEAAPWLLANPEFLACSNTQVYVFSLYWILVCITTVGYGDLVAATLAEYAFVIVLEFVGLLIFSFFMLLASELVRGTEGSSQVD